MTELKFGCVYQSMELSRHLFLLSLGSSWDLFPTNHFNIAMIVRVMAFLKNLNITFDLFLYYCLYFYTILSSIKKEYLLNMEILRD